MTKRALDVVFSLIGLLMTAPLWLGIAVLILAEDGPPVFFRQTRIGRHGRPFTIYKFRTMVVDAEKRGPKVTMAHDPRITRVGRWLRRYKLDELPQLWNVLKGDMSLVGPRPEVPEYLDAYPPEARKLLLSVRPGITDPASIAFAEEERLLAEAEDPIQAYREKILPAKLELALAYVRAPSVGKDLRIIWKTIQRVWWPGRTS